MTYAEAIAQAATLAFTTSSNVTLYGITEATPQAALDALTDADLRARTVYRDATWEASRQSANNGLVYRGAYMQPAMGKTQNESSHWIINHNVGDLGALSGVYADVTAAKAAVDAVLDA